jgi:hypothetical protein
MLRDSFAAGSEHRAFDIVLCGRPSVKWHCAGIRESLPLNGHNGFKIAQHSKAAADAAAAAAASAISPTLGRRWNSRIQIHSQPAETGSITS